MKTTWCVTARQNSKWANEKRRAFESRFPNTHWTFYHSHGKYVFHPTWKGLTGNVLNAHLERSVIELLANTDTCYHGVTFTDMYEHLKQWYSLHQIIDACLHIARAHSDNATSIIGRNGEAMGLRRLI